jgi:toxin secretion/phage lysis holin
MQLYAGLFCIVLGSIITFSFGSWTESLTFLLVVMAVDYVTGVTAAIRDGSGLSSQIGYAGLLKKGMMLLVVLLAHRVDVLLQTDVVMGGATYFYIANEMLSIIENSGRMGLPFPPVLIKIVQVLRDRAGAQESNPSKRKDPKS